MTRPEWQALVAKSSLLQPFLNGRWGRGGSSVSLGHSALHTFTRTYAHTNTFISRCVHTQIYTHTKTDTSTHTDVWKHRHQSAAGPGPTPLGEHVEELTHSQKRKFLGAAAGGRCPNVRSVHLAPEMHAPRESSHARTRLCTNRHAHRHTLLAGTGSAS